MQKKFWDFMLKSLSYVLVAAAAAALTYQTVAPRGYDKVELVRALLNQRFIGEVDQTALDEAAAAAMVDALGDRWSYYIPASEYSTYVEQLQNAYVGIGVTITLESIEKGFEVTQLEPNGGAIEAGVELGDLIVGVEGVPVAELGEAESKNRIKGEVGSYVNITVSRNGEELELSVQRKLIQVTVATGEMVTDEIGLVTIANFDDRCAAETWAKVQELQQAGAKKLIFDVRFNPGGYKEELVEILDHLLPEGPLFRSLQYTGVETVDTSDASCLEMPMAVLVNGHSYSAAEFFAAALSEYEWAVVVGEPTIGKGYFQNAIELSDGSAVNLSVGKYFTPNGVSLSEVGGLQPDVLVEVDDETDAKIYAGLLSYDEDPQVQAAIEALK